MSGDSVSIDTTAADIRAADSSKCESYMPLSVPVSDLLRRLSAAVKEPDADTVTWFHAAPAGQVPAAFADTCIRYGLAKALQVDRTYLERIGAALYAAAVARGRDDEGTRRKAARVLDAEIRRLVHQAQRGNNPRADQFFLELIDTLKCEYQRPSGAGAWPTLKYARTFGWVLNAIGQCRSSHRPYDLDAIIKQAGEALRRQNISLTDVRTAVDLFTHDIPLEDWLGPTLTAK